MDDTGAAGAEIRDVAWAAALNRPTGSNPARVGGDRVGLWLAATASAPPDPSLPFVQANVELPELAGLSDEDLAAVEGRMRAALSDLYRVDRGARVEGFVLSRGAPPLASPAAAR